MRKIKFIADFAGRSKGDEWECDSMLASQLVHADKVAEYVDIAPTEEPKEPKKAKETKK